MFIAKTEGQREKIIVAESYIDQYKMSKGMNHFLIIFLNEHDDNRIS